MKFTIKSSSVKNHLMLVLFCVLPTKALSQNTAGSTVTGAPPPVSAEAAAPWTYTTGLKRTLFNFKNAVKRKSGFENGYNLDADNYQIGGIALGQSQVVVNNNAVSGIVERRLQQQNYNVSGRIYQRLDNGGRMTYRLDRLFANNDGSTGNEDGVKAWAPKVSYLNSQGDFLYDLEYAKSTYKNGEGLSIKQLVPTIGFAINDFSDWINIRAYYISLEGDRTRRQDMSNTKGLDLTWVHFFPASENILMPANISMSYFFGKRMYDVNTGTGTIANLDHYQSGGVNYGAAWSLAKNVGLSLNAGLMNMSEKNTNFPPPPPSQAYSVKYINANLTASF